MSYRQRFRLLVRAQLLIEQLDTEPSWRQRRKMRRQVELILWAVMA